MLKDSASEAFPADATSWCQSCRKLCPVRPQLEDLHMMWPQREDESSEFAFPPLLMDGAGTTCVGWSQSGTQLADAHPAMRPYSIWRNERAVAGEDIIWHENSSKFDFHNHLEIPLQETYDSHTICLGAEDLGIPWARVRNLTFMWKKSSLIWVGNRANVQQEFMNIFKCQTVLTGDAYLIDNEHVAEETRARCSARGFHHNHPNDDLAYWCNVPDAHQLNPSQIEHKNRYIALSEEKNFHPSKGFLMDLGQNPSAQRASCGGFVPRMCTHGLLASKAKGRCFTKRECFYPSGVPAGGGWLKDLIDTMSNGDVMRFAGNGMCMPPSAAWLFFNLCHLERRDLVESKQAWSMVQKVRSPGHDDDDFEGAEELEVVGGPTSEDDGKHAVGKLEQTLVGGDHATDSEAQPKMAAAAGIYDNEDDTASETSCLGHAARASREPAHAFGLDPSVKMNLIQLRGKISNIAGLSRC